MRIHYTKLLATLLLSVNFAAKGQGTFKNLNFELANPGPLIQSPYGISFAMNVPVENALPDWSVYYGSDQQTMINVNDPSLGSTAVTLIAPGNGPIDGNYSVLLQGGITATAASISQTGLVPSGTQSLFFEAQPDYGTFEVLVGSQIIPYITISTGPGYTIYAANISAWAGQTEQLTFSALANENSYWQLDDISFSSQSVPEPNTEEIGITAAAMFGMRMLWRKRGNVAA
jgi:hypothetical protein